MTGNPPPQNVYDDPEFFASYSRFARFGAGWTGAMEHPAFMALLPDVTDARVLDLGCGAGQLARHLAEHGADEVIGVDVSERMLALARADWAHERVTHVRTAIEDAHFSPGRFDLIVSSLAFHYVEDYPSLARRLAEWLAPGGVLAVATEHPMYTAGDQSDGWVRDGDGKVLGWLVAGYAVEGLREQCWIGSGVRKYHRTVASLVNGLLDAGLVIERVVEPAPTEDDLRAHPTWAEELHSPTFILLRARKP